MKKIILLISMFLYMANLSLIADDDEDDYYYSHYPQMRAHHFTHEGLHYKIISDSNVAIVGYNPKVIYAVDTPKVFVVPSKVDYNDKEYSITAIGDRGLTELCAGKVILPESINKIYSESFKSTRCDSLTIPETVKEIEEKAFIYSTLRYIKLPNSLKAINEATFASCGNLHNIELPDSLEVIGKGAFINCSSLESINFKNKLWLLEQSAFESCHNLSSVHFSSSIKHITGLVFKNCQMLRTVTFDSPSNLESIQNEAFNDCKRLLRLDLPEGLKYIWNYAFLGCSNVKHLSIPKSVEIIARSAFGRAVRLKEIKVFWDEPLPVPDIFDWVLNATTTTLIVPHGTVEKYKAAPVWNKFFIKESTSEVDLSPNTANLRITHRDNILSIAGAVKSNLSIYNTCGELLYTCGAFSGECSVPLPLGIYIIFADGNRIVICGANHVKS